MRVENRPREEALPAALAADLEGCFQEVVLAYQDRLFAFALRLMGSPGEAEEVAQDAFVRAYLALRTYPPERVRALALRPWLYRIALNVCRNRWRGRRAGMISLEQAREGGGVALEALDPPDDEARQPEVVAERAEERDRLAGLVAALPERYRGPVVLRFVQGLSYAEAAAVLKQPVGTVKAYAHRGVERLRAALAQLEGRKQDG